MDVAISVLSQEADSDADRCKKLKETCELLIVNKLTAASVGLGKITPKKSAVISNFEALRTASIVRLRAIGRVVDDALRPSLFKDWSADDMRVMQRMSDANTDVAHLKSLSNWAAFPNLTSTRASPGV